MKKTYQIIGVISIVLIITGGVLFANKQTNTPSSEDEMSGKQMTENLVTTGPQVLVDRTHYEFGQVERLGGVVTTDFVLSNIGDDVLLIGPITTSCGCTSASVTSTAIEPGESATVTVVFDPNFHKEPQGSFTRAVFIPTNDSANPELTVTVGVEIIG